jgi:hypothetical protein
VDVFGLRDRLVTDYADFTRSFINIRDDRISGVVEDELRRGLLWPDPLIQLNPGFEPGDTIDQLVDRGVLHPTRQPTLDSPFGFIDIRVTPFTPHNVVRATSCRRAQDPARAWGTSYRSPITS